MFSLLLTPRGRLWTVVYSNTRPAWLWSIWWNTRVVYGTLMQNFCIVKIFPLTVTTGLEVSAVAGFGQGMACTSDFCWHCSSFLVSFAQLFKRFFCSGRKFGCAGFPSLRLLNIYRLEAMQWYKLRDFKLRWSTSDEDAVLLSISAHGSTNISTIHCRISHGNLCIRIYAPFTTHTNPAVSFTLAPKYIKLSRIRWMLSNPCTTFGLSLMRKEEHE